MGMYTELIFGCTLSKHTPKVCIDALDTVINGDKHPKYEEPKDWREQEYNKHFIDDNKTNLALIAKDLSFYHPTTNELLHFEIALPKKYPYTLF